jgi:Zn-dependent M28 family amino/carboxypeptidase
VDGPGGNDNGSGVAGLLEIGQALGGTRSPAAVRLAFWAAEETGLHGSTHYVAGLAEADRAAMLVYLNADMLASPSGFAGVYAASGAAPGSDDVRALLADAIRSAGGRPQDVDLGGASDHAPFDQAGVTTGGVFAGANEIGPDGTVADPCYHQACDDGANLDLELARILWRRWPMSRSAWRMIRSKTRRADRRGAGPLHPPTAAASASRRDLMEERSPSHRRDRRDRWSS